MARLDLVLLDLVLLNLVSLALDLESRELVSPDLASLEPAPAHAYALLGLMLFQKPAASRVAKREWESTAVLAEGTRAMATPAPAWVAVVP